CFEKAQNLAPKDSAAAAMLAAALQAAGRSEDAQKTYRRALSLQPDNPVLSNNLAFLLAESGGDLDEALKLAYAALGKFRDRPNFLDTLGWIYLKKNMTDNAMQIFDNLVKRQPDNPTFRYHRALTLAAKGDKLMARVQFEEALA